MVLKSLKKIKQDIISPPKVGEIVEGQFLSRGKSSLYVDLGAKGVGIIQGREFLQAKEALKNLTPEDVLVVKIIELENNEGYREISLMKASQEMAWERLATAKEQGDILEVTVKGANKGGLLCVMENVQAFLPASQLSPENYPKVEGADPSKIAQELQKLIGKKLKVKIFDLNPDEKKLILSEKAIKKEAQEEELTTYQVGSVIDGTISGVTNFGAFLRFGQNLEGLIRSVELPENSPANTLKIGQIIKAKIIEIANGRVYLSMKDLA
ncbi:MAG: S1 RNA-binding domain-containing protein [Candidatus Gribaldobacteria bacterium]|nr:S1 RNA-binding domain-containing protein [Candidatus Gribaldobacteria bacterium]